MNGFFGRVAVAFRCFFSIVFHGEIPSETMQKIAPHTSQAQSAEATPPTAHLNGPGQAVQETFDRAVQLLGLLQRDGRLIDFLAENISAYPDAQLGAAVRAIHDACRQALDHYIKLEPILSSEEDQPVTVQAGFDATTVKLIGNLRGEPPIRGVLRHKGWRVKEMNLPPLSPGAGRMIVAPAEVELP